MLQKLTDLSYSILCEPNHGLHLFPWSRINCRSKATLRILGAGFERVRGTRWRETPCTYLLQYSENPKGIVDVAFHIEWTAMNLCVCFAHFRCHFVYYCSYKEKLNPLNFTLFVAYYVNDVLCSISDPGNT